MHFRTLLCVLILLLGHGGGVSRGKYDASSRWHRPVPVLLVKAAPVGPPNPLAGVTKIVLNSTLKLTKPALLPNLRLTFKQIKSATSTSFRPALINATKFALPEINSQLAAAGKPPISVRATAELVADAVIRALGGSLPWDTIDGTNKRHRRLAPRGIENYMTCTEFATSALPAFLTAAAWFAIGNAGKNPVTVLTTDQQFFIRAVHPTPPFAQVYYSANFPPFFKKSGAVTMKDAIYFKTPLAAQDVAPNLKFETNGDFWGRTSLLAHEMVHVQQVKKAGSFIAFAYNYLYGYCAAVFSYEGNAFEQEAYGRQRGVDPAWYRPAAHFKNWKRLGLINWIGLPTGANFSNTNGVMLFTKGILQVHPADLPASPSKRFRYFIKGTAAYTAFTKAQCDPNKKPLSPLSKACQADTSPDACDPEWVEEQNALCKASQQSFNNGTFPWMIY